MYKKYGDVIWLGLREVSVIDLNVLLIIYGVNGLGLRCICGLWYDFIVELIKMCVCNL